jgi:hypothetical protein
VDGVSSMVSEGPLEKIKKVKIKVEGADRGRVSNFVVEFGD